MSKQFPLACLLAMAGSIAAAGAPARDAGRISAPAAGPVLQAPPSRLQLSPATVDDPLAVFATAVPSMAAAAPNAAAGNRNTDLVSLREFAALIAIADESVLVQRYEAAIAEQGVRGASAVFEPSFFASSELESSTVQNSSSEILQRAGSADYASRIMQWKSGINVKAPTGADVELSYNVARTSNSLQRSLGISGPEYRSNIGAKLTQPLLRGAGVAATNAAIRVAEREQQVAREMLRQVVTQRVMDGVVAYLNLQRARERVRLRTEASAIATRLLDETLRQQRLGLKSSLDARDAESTATQRRLQLAQAQQDFEEQVNTFQAMIAARERDSGSVLRARHTLPADPLTLLPLPDAAAPELPAGAADSKPLPLAGVQDLAPGSLGLSLARRPEVRVNQLKTEREDIRVEYARNQMLPELSLTVRYGIDDLAQRYRYPGAYLSADPPYNSWAVGLQLRVWLSGDQKRQSEYETAVIRRQQAALAKSAVEQRIANEVESSLKVLDKGMQQLARQVQNTHVQRQLLQIEESLVKEGRKSDMDLMKRQLDVLVAEEALADSIVIANRASFIVSQAQGNVLSRLGVEP